MGTGQYKITLNFSTMFDLWWLLFFDTEIHYINLRSIRLYCCIKCNYGGKFFACVIWQRCLGNVLRRTKVCNYFNVDPPFHTVLLSLEFNETLYVSLQISFYFHKRHLLVSFVATRLPGLVSSVRQHYRQNIYTLHLHCLRNTYYRQLLYFPKMVTTLRMLNPQILLELEEILKTVN